MTDQAQLPVQELYELLAALGAEARCVELNAREFMRHSDRLMVFLDAIHGLQTLENPGPIFQLVNEQVLSIPALKASVERFLTDKEHQEELFDLLEAIEALE